MSRFSSFKFAPTRPNAKRLRLRARRTWRLALIVAAAIAGGAWAVVFAKLCDISGLLHQKIAIAEPWIAPALLPIGLMLAVWLTGLIAPEAAGSGIPQVIAASEEALKPEGVDPRVSVKTSTFKILITMLLLACGASIGREGPTVQVVAATVFLFTRNIRGGPGRRALLIAGGAAGVAAAFNAPIAGVVFAVEELAKGFDRKTNAVVILVVVAAGAAAYALAGNYAYFQGVQGSTAWLSAWFAAPVLGVICGATGGAFSRVLATVIGPSPGRVGQFKQRRPILFAGLCGMVALLAAVASHGLSYGTGYAEASSLLAGHPGRGLTLALSKWIANLAAAASGAPGGIFSPSLATGAGIGAAFAHIAPFASGRDTIVLGMAAYLAGVVQAPLTSAVILMEMTRDPGLVGPLMFTALIARAVSAQICPEPIYHLLAHKWRLPRRPKPAPEPALA